MNDLIKDNLMTKIAQGEARDRDWDGFVALAEEDDSLWREAIEMQRDQAALTGLMECASDVADGVDLPSRESVLSVRRMDMRYPGVAEPPERHRPVTRSSSWVGWAVAAVIMFAWVTTVIGPPSVVPGSGTGSGMHEAGLVSVGTAQEALDAYLNKGRQEGVVLEEQPRRLLLQTRPNPGGEGFELIYVHQIMERTVVSELYQFEGQDEMGQPRMVRYEQPQRKRM